MRSVFLDRSLLLVPDEGDAICTKKEDNTFKGRQSSAVLAGPRRVPIRSLLRFPSDLVGMQSGRSWNGRCALALAYAESCRLSRTPAGLPRLRPLTCLRDLFFGPSSP